MKNVLFIFTDDQRFDTINALGNDAIETPHMDNLVERGLTFTRAHIPGGTAGAVCMPSRGMLMTGRTLFHLKDEGQSIPAEHITFPELLQQHGYNCYGSGKWHNGKESFARSFNQGAEIFFGGMADHWNVPVYNFDPSGAYDATLPEIKAPMQNNDVGERQCDHIHSGQHSTDVIMSAAVDYLDSYKDDKPFCMYVSLLAPHDPRSMPKRFKELYSADEIELPDNYMTEHPFDFSVSQIRDEKLAAQPRDETEIRQHIAEYYAMISHIDYQLGEVMDALERSGTYDDTLVVFAGDNGLAVGQHGLMGKQNHYEHSIRVPLIFAGPDVPEGVQADSYAYLLDIYPTLCDYLGIDKPQTVEGKSLLPVFENTETHVRDELYFAYTDLLRSVKDQRYKLIEYRTEDLNKTQLFDLQQDPQETNDLSGDSAQADLIKALRQRLQQWRTDWEDSGHRMSETFWSRYEQAAR